MNRIIYYYNYKHSKFRQQERGDSMTQQLTSELFKFPPDISAARLHRNANRIFKSTRSRNPERCPCCEKIVGNKESSCNCCYQNIELAVFGSGVPLLFNFIRHSIVMLLIVSLTSSAYSLYSNYSGTFCAVTQLCTEAQVANRMSFVNKLNDSKETNINCLLIAGSAILQLLALQWFRKSDRQLQIDCDICCNSPSDYAIILRRLPLNTQQTHIQQMIDERRKQLTLEERKQTDNLKVQKVIMSYWLGDYLRCLQEGLTEFRKAIQESQNPVYRPRDLPVLNETASFAIVVFSSPNSKELFIHRPTMPQKLLQCICSIIVPLSGQLIQGEKVNIERAPQPDDIIWKNSRVSPFGSLCRKIVFNLVSVLLLLLGGGCQYGLALLETMQVPNSTAQTVVQIISSLFITLFNAIIVKVLIWLSHLERCETLTEFNVALMVKVCFFQFLNTGLFVVLSFVLVHFRDFKLPSSFMMQNITNVMIVNAVIPTTTQLVLTWLDLGGKLYRWLITRGTIKLYQQEANKAFQLPPVQIPFKYGYVLKTVWLASLYSTLTPIVVPLSLFGLAYYYFAQKFLFGSSYSAPNMIGSMINDTAIELLEYSPLIMVLGELALYLSMHNWTILELTILQMLAIMVPLVLASLNLLLPMEIVNKKLFKVANTSGESPPYHLVETKFQVTYQMLNPAYKSERKRLELQITPQAQIKALKDLIKNDEAAAGFLDSIFNDKNDVFPIDPGAIKTPKSSKGQAEQYEASRQNYESSKKGLRINSYIETKGPIVPSPSAINRNNKPLIQQMSNRMNESNIELNPVKQMSFMPNGEKIFNGSLQFNNSKMELSRGPFKDNDQSGMSMMKEQLQNAPYHPFGVSVLNGIYEPDKQQGLNFYVPANVSK